MAWADPAKHGLHAHCIPPHARAELASIRHVAAEQTIQYCCQAPAKCRKTGTRVAAQCTAAAAKCPLSTLLKMGGSVITLVRCH